MHCHRNFFTWFEYEAVTEGESDRNGPHGDHDGEVERDDTGDDAEGLTELVTGDVAGNLEDLSRNDLGEAAGVFDGFETFVDAREGFGLVFPAFGDDDFGEVLYWEGWLVL